MQFSSNSKSWAISNHCTIDRSKPEILEKIVERGHNFLQSQDHNILQ